MTGRTGRPSGSTNNPRKPLNTAAYLGKRRGREDEMGDGWMGPVVGRDEGNGTSIIIHDGLVRLLLYLDIGRYAFLHPSFPCSLVVR